MNKISALPKPLEEAMLALRIENTHHWQCMVHYLEGKTILESAKELGYSFNTVRHYRKYAKIFLTNYVRDAFHKLINYEEDFYEEIHYD